MQPVRKEARWWFRWWRGLWRCFPAQVLQPFRQETRWILIGHALLNVVEERTEYYIWTEPKNAHNNALFLPLDWNGTNLLIEREEELNSIFLCKHTFARSFQTNFKAKEEEDHFSMHASCGGNSPLHDGVAAKVICVRGGPQLIYERTLLLSVCE